MRGRVSAIPVAAAIVLPFWGYAKPKAPLLATGVTLLVGAAVLRFWSRRYIGRSSDTKRRKVTAFVTGGPYAHVRNPLYIANIAAAVGLCLLVGHVPLACVTLAIASLEYNLIVRDEEDLLAAAFPEAFRYFDAVPRWFPVPGRVFKDGSAPRATWKEVFRREGKRLAQWGIAFAAVAYVKFELLH